MKKDSTHIVYEPLSNGLAFFLFCSVHRFHVARQNYELIIVIEIMNNIVH